VVVEVGVPRVAHQRIRDVREELVKPSVLWRKHTIHVDVLMAQQGIGSDIPSLHYTMHNSM